MKISRINIEKTIKEQKRIKITKAPDKYKKLEGATGTVTNSFGDYEKKSFGLFLDIPLIQPDFNDIDIINITNDFEFDFIESFI